MTGQRVQKSSQQITIKRGEIFGERKLYSNIWEDHYTVHRILVLDKMFDEGASCKLFLLFVLFACNTSAISPSSNFVYDGDVQYEDNNNTLSEVSMPPGQASTISCCINCLMNTSCKAVEICSTPSENKCRLSKGETNTTGTAAGATCKRYKMVSIFL